MIYRVTTVSVCKQAHSIVSQFQTNWLWLEFDYWEQNGLGIQVFHRRFESPDQYISRAAVSLVGRVENTRNRVNMGREDRPYLYICKYFFTNVNYPTQRYTAVQTLLRHSFLCPDALFNRNTTTWGERIVNRPRKRVLRYSSSRLQKFQGSR